MSRVKQAEQRRNDLMDAAEAVFVEKGISATTIDEITSRAGVAKGTFYLYFRSKEALVAAVRERFVRSVAAAQDTAIASSGDDWLAKLDAWIEAGVRGFMDRSALHEALFQHDDIVITSSDSASRDNLHSAQLASLMRAGIDTGTLAPNTNTAIAAMLLYSALHGALEYLIHHDDESVGSGDLIREAQRLCRNYLRPHCHPNAPCHE